MTLKTWSFSKKHNSTAQPTGASRDYTVYMKENTSIENPVFILGTGIDADLSYCQWSGNYYFVDDIVLISADQVELHCSIDVLATHKTAIGNYSAFIERAAAAHNAYLIDNALSVQQKIIAEAISTQALWNIDQVGCYIVRVVGQGDAPTGITSYILSTSEISSMVSDLFDDSAYAELTDALAKTFFNPFQYIVSVMWFPMSKSDIAGASADMWTGWWRKGSYKRMSSYFYFNTYDLTLPTNYYANDFRAYHASFTELSMFLPGVGTISLDPIIMSYGKLNLSVAIDWVTGSVNYRLRAMDANDSIISDISTYSGQIGVPVPVGQVNNTGNGAQDSISNAVIPAITDFAANYAPGGAINPINAAKNSLSKSLSVLGNAGNRANITSNPRLILSIKNYGCAAFPNTHYGRPLCDVRTINTLSGFIKCNAASIALDAPDTEIDKVNNYLNGGFYYE